MAGAGKEDITEEIKALQRGDRKPLNDKLMTKVFKQKSIDRKGGINDLN